MPAKTEGSNIAKQIANNMNKELWDKIAQFDFDSPPSEYGFSTRLANENYWTKDFTEQAILEYKKFMYLAATSDFMVSPSAIVDTVWHQHLIFTQSYYDFCNLLKKQVQHIPSTHNKEEFQKFKQAKERTSKLYENNFGRQPRAFWDYDDMYESLNLEKAKIKLRTFIIIGIFTFIGLTIPFYFLLRPIYLTIDNPHFIWGYIGLTMITLLGLELYNSSRLRHIINLFDRESFIYNLHPYELVYLKTQELSNVINGVVNELIEDSMVQVNSDNTIEIQTGRAIKSSERFQTMATLSELGKTSYPTLLKQLARKPLFLNVVNSMEAFKKYFNKSVEFGRLFYLNFGVLSFLLMLGFIRLTTGILRDKPVMLITIAVIALSVMIIYYLNRLTELVCVKTIPNLYKDEILPTRQNANDWQWRYFLLGTVVLSTPFVPMAKYVDRKNSTGTNCGTSCGSSCGSSCSSCGGCGGD